MSPGARALRTRLSTSPTPPTAGRASRRRAGSWRRPRSRRRSAQAPNSRLDRTAWCARSVTGRAGRTRRETRSARSSPSARPTPDTVSPRPSIWGPNQRPSRCPATSGPTAGPRSRSRPEAMPCTSRSPRTQPGAAHSDIVVTASHNRGRTWSPLVTATPDDGVIYFQPNLAVDDAGRVAISAFALAHGRIDEVLLVSRPRELRFGPPLRVTTRSVRSTQPDDGVPRQIRRLVARRLARHHQ